jgi:serine protease Do
VGSPGELRNQVASLGATSDVELEVVRAGRRMQVRADLALMPNEPVTNEEGASTNAAGRAGLQLVPLDSVARKHLDVPRTVESGLVVTSVESGSPAAEAGLRPGDVLIELNRRPITHVEQFSDAWNAGKEPMALLVARGSHKFYVALEAKGQAK